jgi:universal stress protein A
MVADTVVEIGRPYEQIVAAAKTHNIDLIIIATRGYTGLKHLFIGSTAERVVRHAPCPVLTVREREQDFVR